MISRFTFGALGGTVIDISSDCTSSNISGLIMPGKYVLSRESEITDAQASACAATRQITITAHTAYADTLYQTEVYYPGDHYPNAANVFHVVTPNVVMSDQVIMSNALPGRDDSVFAGAGVRFDGSAANGGAFLNNHVWGMQTSAADTHGAQHVTISGNTISCTPFGGGSRAVSSMGINVRGGGDAYITVDRNTVADCEDEAVLVESASHVRVANNDIECYVSECGLGISLQARVAAGCSTYSTDADYVGYNTVNGYQIRFPIVVRGSGSAVNDTIESGRYTYNQNGVVMRAHHFVAIVGNGMYNDYQWGACVYGTNGSPAVQWNDYSGDGYGTVTWNTGC